MASLPDFETPIFGSDFEKYAVDAVIGSTQPRTCEHYAELFFTEARRLVEINDQQGFQLFRVLAEACHLVPQFGNTKSAFRPWKEDYEKQCSSMRVEHFTPEQCGAFAEALPKIADHELRARLADLVTIKNFDHRIVATAADAYLESALTLMSRERWFPCVERLRRALWLSSRPGIDQAIHKKIVSEIKRLIDENQGQDTGILTAHLISLIIEFVRDAAPNYIEIATELAERARMNRQWYTARCYFLVIRDVHRGSKPAEEEGAGTAVASIAETFALEAEEAQDASPPQYGKACHCYEEALDVYKAVKGKRERRAELYKRLLISQERGIQEMAFEPIRVTIPQAELSKVVEAAQQTVKGKSFREAVLTLARLLRSLDFETTAQKIRHPENPSVWPQIYRQNLIDEHGKTKARKESVLADTDENSEFAYAYCRNHALWHWRLTTAGLLHPALGQISEEHAIRPEDILFITEQNELVPLDRMTLISRGLYHGFLGDLQLALHLLIPQFENSLRFILHQRGAVASKMDAGGLQNEQNVNTLLPGHPVLEQILGKSLLWDFWALLVAKWGGNIRNQIAHGMMPDGNFFASEGIYTWCLLLKFYCLPLVVKGKGTAEKPDVGPQTT